MLTGILLAESEFMGRLLQPYIVASQVVPKLALGPLFIIWFGFGMTSTVVITALICFFPLMENTATGLRQVDPARRELFRMLRASRLQTLLRLKLPAALPVIMAGLRVAVVLALVGAVVGRVHRRPGRARRLDHRRPERDGFQPDVCAVHRDHRAGNAVLPGALALERVVLRHHLKG